jgi:hypothetical protein
MLLLILVSVGLSIYCFSIDDPAYGVLSLIGMSPKIGMVVFGVVGLSLLYEGHYVAGVIPLLLIAWNIYGLKYMQKD